LPSMSLYLAEAKFSILEPAAGAGTITVVTKINIRSITIFLRT